MRKTGPRHSDGDDVAAIAARITADNARRNRNRLANVAALTRVEQARALRCTDVPHPLEVGLAHRLVQKHRDCGTDRCPCRAAALDVLREAGHYVPASNFDAAAGRRLR